MIDVQLDDALVEEIAARFDLRDPNKRALRAIVERLSEANEEFVELVADLATGVGKTFLMSALVEYLAVQGVRHVLVVTPNDTIQRKTVANFDEASARYVAGADVAPFIVTPGNFRAGAVGTALRNADQLKVFVFNVQQLIRPSVNVSRRVREDDENLGGGLYEFLEGADDLFVIADEHHVYHESARAFSAGVRELSPVALIGLTATPDAADVSKIVFQYTLGEAIADGIVKTPVIVYRKDGQKDERTQLADACQLLRGKARLYEQYAEAAGKPAVRPVLFVVASSIEHATEVGQVLAQQGLIGDPGAVLEVTSQSSDEALAALESVEAPDSPIRAIVSVNMLREGWDVKNIAVIVALRKLASQTLTEQILGRGLRLPYGALTGVSGVDQVDLVAHDSYQQLLAQKNLLRQRLQATAVATPVDANGAADATSDADARAEEGATGVENVAASVDAAAAPSGTPAPIGGGTWWAPTLAGLEFPDEPEGVPDVAEGAGPVLEFVEAESRRQQAAPQLRGRVGGSPQIQFPREETELVVTQFTLADVPDGDAEAAGARFIREVPTFIFRDALVAQRTGNQVTISVAPQHNEEAAPVLATLDVVRLELEDAIMQQREVTAARKERNGATRLVTAFLKGAGVSSSEQASAEWGNVRRQQALEGLKELIRAAIKNRPQQRRSTLREVVVPIEPVLVDADAPNAYNAPFRKHVNFTGWLKSIMPVQSFDAKSTEWRLAQLMDRDDEIVWWQRLYVGGPAFIPTPIGNYFPDLIAIDAQGTRWVIEGKSDVNAEDPDVVTKRTTAERWARGVRDDGRFGEWRYLFVTESTLRQAAGTWNGLLATAAPE